MRKSSKNKSVLITEEHPEDYNGYEFITLVRYNDKNFLTIVDNVIDNSIFLYVLDFCNQLYISEEDVITIANEWYESNKEKYPLSVEFSKREIGAEMSKILREFNIDYVTRVIGPTFIYNMKGRKKVRRRKKKSLPENMVK